MIVQEEDRLPSMRTPLMETLWWTLLVEIYLEELDLAIPIGYCECSPTWREEGIHQISTDILELQQAMLYISWRKKKASDALCSSNQICSIYSSRS